MARKKRYYRMIIQRPGYVTWGTEACCFNSTKLMLKGK